jgi:hypothetical protein
MTGGQEDGRTGGREDRRPGANPCCHPEAKPKDMLFAILKSRSFASLRMTCILPPAARRPPPALLWCDPQAQRRVPNVNGADSAGIGGAVVE